VAFEQAAFCVLGSIALQGVRLARPGLGETAFVIGLGLLGQITVALLRAAGCRVLGTDLDAGKCELALRMGAEVARPGLSAREVLDLTGGAGADAVLVAASTPSSGPVEAASEAVRQKGRIVLVGAVGMEFPRRPLYFKEAEIVVSCSYGPGRYDPSYEERGRDYPLGHVRWTEQRNLQAVLDLMASGRLDVRPLVSHRFAIERATEAYDLIEKGEEPYLGIVLEFGEEESQGRVLDLKAAPASGDLGVGVIGTGTFARMVLLPAIAAVAGVRARVVCSAKGLSAAHAGKRRDFERATSDPAEVLSDPAVGAVVIATQHDLHAGQVLAALSAGKHVFVEKPLALTLEEIDAIEEALRSPAARGRLLMVGFNRRFAPASVFLKSGFEGVAGPLTVSIRFNAGAIPADHWTQDEEVGGGRLVGEACHAIDLATFLVGSPPVRVFAESIGGTDAPSVTDDQAFLTLRHENGSISSVGYLAGGDKAFAKERVEVFGGGRVGVIEDFRSASLVKGGRTTKRSWRGQDKGHKAGMACFLDAARAGGASPIPWSESRAVSRASILAQESIRLGFPIDV